MASATLHPTRSASQTLPALRVLGQGALAALGALAINLVLRALFVATLPADAAAFFGLGLVPVAFATLVGVAGATAAWLVVRRLARDPVRTYRRVAALALALSLLPGLAMHLNPTPQGAMAPGALAALWTMHVATALVAVPLLARAR